MKKLLLCCYLFCVVMLVLLVVLVVIVLVFVGVIYFKGQIVEYGCNFVFYDCNIEVLCLWNNIFYLQIVVILFGNVILLMNGIVMV